MHSFSSSFSLDIIYFDMCVFECMFDITVCAHTDEDELNCKTGVFVFVFVCVCVRAIQYFIINKIHIHTGKKMCIIRT